MISQLPSLFIKVVIHVILVIDSKSRVLLTEGHHVEYPSQVVSTEHVLIQNGLNCFIYIFMKIIQVLYFIHFFSNLSYISWFFFINCNYILITPLYVMSFTSTGKKLNKNCFLRKYILYM